VALRHEGIERHEQVQVQRTKIRFMHDGYPKDALEAF
jgi:hypothetical protein